MAELTLELLRAELAPLRAELATIRTELTALRGTVDALEPHVAGIPIIHRTLDILRQESRQITAQEVHRAVQFTAGEVEALHADVNKTMSREDELEARIAVLERRVRELERPLP